LIAVALIAALMRWVLPRLVAAMARSQERPLEFALAWGRGWRRWAHGPGFR